MVISTNTFLIPDVYGTWAFEHKRKQIFWGNQFIKINKKCLFFRTWIKTNIIFSDDLIHDKSKIDKTLFQAN